jgi:hypothetical protein
MSAKFRALGGEVYVKPSETLTPWKPLALVWR